MQYGSVAALNYRTAERSDRVEPVIVKKRESTIPPRLRDSKDDPVATAPRFGS
jgi:hypothetical protein